MPFPLEILLDGIQLANELTLGVQSTIQHYAYIGQADSYGKELYANPVSLSAIVDTKYKQIMIGGQLQSIAATITILEDVLPNGAVTNPIRREPIDPRDKIVLANGVTGPIISAPSSVINPLTGRGLVQEILLGARYEPRDTARVR